MAYVPGRHAGNIVGSQGLGSLRTLVGVEGNPGVDRVPAFILGLGYDGILAEAVVDLFQVANFSCVYGDPGVTRDAVARAKQANLRLLTNAERIEAAPASSCVDSCFAFQRLTQWYRGRDVVVVAMGPKPHVVGAMLAAIADRTVAFRFAMKTRTDPVQVFAAPGAVPFACRFEPES
jgi:hypothetical protein